MLRLLLKDSDQLVALPFEEVAFKVNPLDTTNAIFITLVSYIIKGSSVSADRMNNLQI